MCMCFDGDAQAHIFERIHKHSHGHTDICVHAFVHGLRSKALDARSGEPREVATTGALSTHAIA